MIDELQSLVANRVLNRVEQLAQSYRQQQLNIVKDQEGADLDRLIDLTEAQFLGRFNKEFIRERLNQLFTRLGLEVDRDLVRTFGEQQIGINPPDQAMIDNMVRTTVGKITDLSQSTLGQLRAEITQGLINGDRWETIAKRLQVPPTSSKTVGRNATPFQKAANRAKFIARNEVTTALGTYNKSKQEQAGIDLYIWQTAEDERVRPTHEDLNGRIFSWKGEVTVNNVTYVEAVDPSFSSSGTIPGEPWNCRCVALPYLPEIEE